MCIPSSIATQSKVSEDFYLFLLLPSFLFNKQSALHAPLLCDGVMKRFGRIPRNVELNTLFFINYKETFRFTNKSESSVESALRVKLSFLYIIYDKRLKVKRVFCRMLKLCRYVLYHQRETNASFTIH